MTEWVVTSSLLVLVVLALRAAFGKRISAGLRYALWAVVLVRLLVPVSFLSVAVPRLPAWEPPEVMLEESIYVLPVGSAPAGETGAAAWTDGTVMEANSFGYSRLEDSGTKVVRYAEKISPLELLGWVWMAGAVVMGAVLIAANLRFTRRLRRTRKPLEGTGAPVPVYVAAGLPSPCLIGLMTPAVYVTAETAADPDMLRHILTHELTHYNHLDHLWSVLRGIALAVHWWNPLVWLAVVCSRRDGELACDEGALKRLGDGERRAYGETLLALVTAGSRPGDLFSFATTMGGGKRSLKERIQRIACKPKQLVSAMAVVIVAASLSVLVAFGQAKDTGTDDTPELNQEAPLHEEEFPFSAAWQDAQITLGEGGTTHTVISAPTGTSDIESNPIPAPREWADDDLAGRKEAAALTGSPEVWAKLVSPKEGWLVACYERGVAAADTYVYKTEDSGRNWTEAAMPGTGWHISDVGFLSPDRLIVAQRLFNDAPCLITKDGGETWEEIELPDNVVKEILFEILIDGEAVVMDIGPNEVDLETYVMTSEDLGDHWTVAPAEPFQSVQPDLDHDGIPDTLTVRKTEEEWGTVWNLEFTASYMSSPAWEDEALSPHAGWTSFFLCRMEGEDYLLKYTPYIGGEVCDYSYKLFYLTAGGEEVVVQENSVEFDINFTPEYAEQHQYDPRAINAFMEEINALLAHSELLVSTDENLLETFRQEGRLYDSVWWLDKAQDDTLNLLDNLLNYGGYAQDHPDDTWSPLADLLLGLTEEDIVMFNGDTSELVRLLRGAERGSRFYEWDSEVDAYRGAGAEEVDYTIWNVSLADGSTLCLYACEDRPSVLMIYEMPEEVISAFYTAPELREWILDADRSPN